MHTCLLVLLLGMGLSREQTDCCLELASLCCCRSVVTLLLRSEVLRGSEFDIPPFVLLCCSTFTICAVPAPLCLTTAITCVPDCPSVRAVCQQGEDASSSSRLVVEGNLFLGVVLGLALCELAVLKLSELEWTWSGIWAERSECMLLSWYTGFWKQSGCRLRCWLKDGCSGRRICGALWGTFSLSVTTLACCCCGWWWWRWGRGEGCGPMDAWEPTRPILWGTSWRWCESCRSIREMLRPLGRWLSRSLSEKLMLCRNDCSHTKGGFPRGRTSVCNCTRDLEFWISLWTVKT